MTNATYTRKMKRIILLLAFLILLAALTLIPWPYYIYQPGSIENLANYVKVENGHTSEKGSFNLTTVFSIKVNNSLTMLYGLFAKNTEIRKADSVRGTLTDDQYMALLDHMMISSQNNAIVAALEQAEKPVPLHYTGIFVQAIYADSKAAGVLFPGDVIVEADGKPVSQLSDVAAILAVGKKVGDSIELVLLRGEQQLTVAVELYGAAAPAENASADAAVIPRIGIVTEDQYTIEPPVQVDFTVSDIGGPSAGLMFSLEILDQLNAGELTGGKFIAGTGTIDALGQVGQIGGIRDKIVAAELAGVDVFFCPADVNAADSNEKDILDEASKRGYDITIVPVRTLADTVNYLDGLAG